MIGFQEGSAAVLYLNEPREKIWGLVVSVSAAGVVLRGLRLDSFEDWMRQEARNEEELLGLVTSFYPLPRIERLEEDRSVGSVVSYSQRFAEAVGRSVHDAVAARTAEREAGDGDEKTKTKNGGLLH
ncbi:MAG: hypothetical protein JJE39_05330 [Vicinamibacteria bacterium]|nr:hypothetical protein [Vicinamibacteria bacterium]